MGNAYLYFAIAHFGLSDYDSFLEHIKKMAVELPAKHFRMANYHLLQNNPSEARTCISLIPKDYKNAHTLIMFVEGMACYQEGKTDEGRKILNDVMPNIHYKLLKDMASEALSD